MGGVATGATRTAGSDENVNAGAVDGALGARAWDFNVVRR